MATQRSGRRTAHLAVAVGLVPGVAGCGGTDVAGAPVERKAFPFSGPSLTVDSEDGEVVLVPADVAGVEVTRQVDGWVVFGDGPEAHWRMEGGTLTLRVECGAVVEDCAARYEVRVPRDVVVTVVADNGAVSAESPVSALTVRAGSGDVIVRDARGPLDLYSAVGALRVERAASGVVAARSDNGDVHLGPRGAPGRVGGRSSHGDVVVEPPSAAGPYAVDAGSGSGEATSEVPRDPDSFRTVTAFSENGDVAVRTAN